MACDNQEEKANFTRLNRLLVDKGTEALRNTFDAIHPPATLPAVLNANRKSLLRLRFADINDHHWNLLFPLSDNPPDSKTFDIALLIALLRSICGFPAPVTGWSTMPPGTDRSRQANITRIKLFGHEFYTHATSTQVDSVTFENLWQQISQVLVDLMIPQNEIDDLKTCPLGPEEKLHVQVLKDLFLKEEECKDMPVDIQESVQHLTQTTEEKFHLEKKKRGSLSKEKSTDRFFLGFVCGHLAKHGEARRLITLEEDPFRVIRFNDIDVISSIYCDFKEKNGRKVTRDLKKMKTNFKIRLGKFEKGELLKNVGNGKEYGKDYLAYNFKNSELWLSLTRNYPVQRNSRMKHENFPASHAVLSSEPSTTSGAAESDEPFVEENFRESHSVLSKVPFSESPESWKWEKSSIIHREKFIKLLKYGQDYPDKVKEVNGVRVCCSKDFLIGMGADGTRVYVGLGRDGYERAVKRLPRDACSHLAEDEKEILNMAKSNNVVNYWFLDDKCDNEHLFLILDLCEETLENFVESKDRSLNDLVTIAPEIIQQVLNGLADLHRGPKPILHRDLKPSNILRNFHGNWLLADFGISRILTGGATTHLSNQRGTKHWRAVESYPSNGMSDDGEVRYKKESDIQAAGMVAFYIVTKGQHPFGEEADRLRNLLDGRPVDLDKLTDHVLKDLLSWMLSHDPKDRPSAEEALKHPYLQSKKLQFEMLCEVGNQFEIKTRDVDSDVVRKLNNDLKDWRPLLRPDVLKYLCTDLSKMKTFFYRPLWTDCLRFIRNVKVHWEDRPRPRPEVFYVVGDPQKYFLNLFPNLPVVVHKIIRLCDWKNRSELKEYFA